MNKGAVWGIIIVLLAVIAVLAWIILAPSTAQAPTVSTNIPQATSDSDDEPLHTRVRVSTPLPNTAVGKTFSVIGEAPGNWYFEASFPVQVRDKDGNLLVSAPAQAQADWMTTAQVPFRLTLTIDSNYNGPALLILLKDNPSGLPENDDALEIPIVIE